MNHCFVFDLKKIVRYSIVFFFKAYEHIFTVINKQNLAGE